MPVTDYPPLTLEIMDMVGDKWTLLVVYTLGESPLRFSELRRRAAPVSQKMLTQTLRALERHAMVDRTVLPTAPPQVEYALTPLGETLLETIGQLVSWADAHIAEIQAAQADYDVRSGPPPCPDAELPDEDAAS